MPQVHTEQAKFTVYVLWLQGHTELTCAALAGMRRKQVAGLIARSPYANRAAMTDEERQALLTTLKFLRMQDGGPIHPGFLRDDHFKILPLTREQLRVGTR
jgi:hypothetical protein